MKRLLFALAILPSLQAESVREILDAAPRLDAPGPGYSGRVFVPLELSVKSSGDSAFPSTEPGTLNPWDKAHLLSEPSPQASQPPPNPAIDYEAFAKNVLEVGRLRKSRRISEEDFLRMAAEPDTIILDARSREKFLGLHIQGAKNLSLPDMTAAELAKIIPSKTTCVLIYCNNNFEDLSVSRPPFQKITPSETSGEEAAKPGKPHGSNGFVVFRKEGDGAMLLPRKTGSASLNVYTFNTLFSYGYTNVYELGPLIEIQKSKLPFEGTSVLENE